MTRRFPLRTLLLMILALAAFARLWWLTHRSAPPKATLIELQGPDGG